MNALNINSCHLPTKFLQPANLTILSLFSHSWFSPQVEPTPHLLSTCHPRSTTLLITNHQPLFQICITSPVESSSLLHSVNLILFTVLLVHLILHVSPHQPPPAYLLSPSITRMTFHWKLIFFTHPFLHSHSYHGLPSRSWILTCIELKGHWRLFVLVSSFYIFFWLRVLD